MIKIKLPTDSLPFLREMDSRLVSYNIEMTEVTGGTFWKLYTPGQIEGREEASEGAWFTSPDCRIRDGVRAR